MFKNLFNSVVNFLRPLVTVTVKELAQIALNAVVSEVPKVVSGQEKFNSAVNNVANTLKTSGKTAAISLIEVAVEAAYQGLSNSLKAK